MPKDVPYPSMPTEYGEWLALYFRNRLTSAYAPTMADAAPDDMSELLRQADNACAKAAATS